MTVTAELNFSLSKKSDPFMVFLDRIKNSKGMTDNHALLLHERVSCMLFEKAHC